MAAVVAAAGSDFQVKGERDPFIVESVPEGKVGQTHEGN
jgi:hypothetical protein